MCSSCSEGSHSQPGHFVLVREQDCTERSELVDNRLDAGLRGNVHVGQKKVVGVSVAGAL